MSGGRWGIWASGIGYVDHWMLMPDPKDGNPRIPVAGSREWAEGEAARLNKECDIDEHFEARPYVKLPPTKAEARRELLTDVRDWLKAHTLQAGAKSLIERLDAAIKENP